MISKHSKKRPILIFCFTRSSAEETASNLANWWSFLDPYAKRWDAPTVYPSVRNETLKQAMMTGVAYHHGGVDPTDRTEVEKSFQADGGINIICCTTTLAVGVNLPCHFVILKNTVTYEQSEGCCKEYSDLDIMQMLGRAGRPQFDRSAVAVIMTRQEKVKRYENMIAGKQVLESRYVHSCQKLRI